MTYEEICKRFHQAIEDEARKNLNEIQHVAHKQISVLCEVIGASYDWFNSFQLFEDWVNELDTSEAIKEKLASLYRTLEEADEEWKDVYYGLEGRKWR